MAKELEVLARSNKVRELDDAFDMSGGAEATFVASVCTKDRSHVVRPARSPFQKARIKLAFDPAPDFLFSSRFVFVQARVVESFRKANLTGFEVTPIEAVAANGGAAPKYFQLLVTGWGGMASPESGVKLRSSCAACSRLDYSPVKTPQKIADPKQHDGSDFFMVWPLPRLRFLSERAAALIRSAGFTGVEPIAPSKLPKDEDDFIRPGRLSEWMPRERAAALGKPLGID